MSWLSDTWKEVTSGGKANTKTYNASPGRPASSSRPQQGAKKLQAPAPKQDPARIVIPAARGGGSGGGRMSMSVPASAPRSNAGSSRALAATQAATAAAEQATRDANARTQQATKAQPAPAIDQNDPDAGLNMVRQGLVNEQGVRDASRGEPGQYARQTNNGDGTPRKPKPRDGEDKPKSPKAATTIKIGQAAFEGLSDRQKSGVLFNTELVRAARADEGTGAAANTTQFLSELDLLRDDTDLDAFLGLDRAIGISILDKLDDAPTRQTSAESARWARGDSSAAPQATKFNAALGNASQAADAMSNRLMQGFNTLRGDSMAPGFGDTPRDQLIRNMYDAMVDSSVQQTPDDVAEGIALVNAAQGTDITPQEVWDFAGLQLRAADFGSLRGGQASVPVGDTTITPLSVQEIRQRYGL